MTLKNGEERVFDPHEGVFSSIAIDWYLSTVHVNLI